MAGTDGDGSEMVMMVVEVVQNSAKNYDYDGEKRIFY
jgi:hypothetical protein